MGDDREIKLSPELAKYLNNEKAKEFGVKPIFFIKKLIITDKVSTVRYSVDVCEMSEVYYRMILESDPKLKSAQVLIDMEG